MFRKCTDDQFNTSLTFTFSLTIHAFSKLDILLYRIEKPIKFGLFFCPRNCKFYIWSSDIIHFMDKGTTIHKLISRNEAGHEEEKYAGKK